MSEENAKKLGKTLLPETKATSIFSPSIEVEKPEPLDPFSLLEPFNLIEAGKGSGAAMIDFVRMRGMPMDSFQPEAGICCWCGVSKVASRRRKYCSDDCQMSAFFNCYPHKPAAKAWMLIRRQQCACAGCGEDFSEMIKNKILKRYGRDGKFEPVAYFSIGDNTGHIWQVDHIIRIADGGNGIGLKNVQVLCVKCHREKTRWENTRHGS